MIHAGIDPGAKGAIVILNDFEILEILDMPTHKVGSKMMVDLEEVRKMLQVSYMEMITIEQVGSSPMMGVSGAFNFGASFNGVCGVAIGMGLRVETVTPQRWKTTFGLHGKEKEAARLKAIDRYPSWSNSFKRKSDVDRADALFIGLFTAEKYKV